MQFPKGETHPVDFYAPNTENRQFRHVSWCSAKSRNLGVDFWRQLVAFSGSVLIFMGEKQVKKSLFLLANFKYLLLLNL